MTASERLAELGIILPAVAKPLAAYGRMGEQSAGKDTTIGHWEIAGLVTNKPFPLFPHGFPPELIRSIEQAIGQLVETVSHSPIWKDTATDSEKTVINQPRGVEITYRVTAINTNGPGPAVTSTQVVL